MPQDRKPEDLARRMAEFAAELKRLAVELKRDLRKKPPAPSVSPEGSSLSGAVGRGGLRRHREPPLAGWLAARSRLAGFAS